MSSFSIDPADSRTPIQIRAELTSFADELCATVARIFVYVGTLALFTILAIHGWHQLHAVAAGDPSGKARWSKAGWSVADHSHPAFAVSQPDPAGKSVTYTIFRHPLGGRRDVLRWTGTNGQPVAELEIERFGGEIDSSPSQNADLAARMELPHGAELETAGVIDSKFGAVTLLHQAGSKESATQGTSACLGFVKRFDDPALRISGWSCEGDALPARRNAVGCLLDRLVLLVSGNEPKLAQLFARAELKRGTCLATGPSVADWMTGPATPELRGTFAPD
ncbi:hypothetical protein [Bradyrhizobium sp.]|uniref:hypothetical protein n=1 Tax=Bradyrhizobium sp. TaxID=376 RepID=UPI003C5F77C8